MIDQAHYSRTIENSPNREAKLKERIRKQRKKTALEILLNKQSSPEKVRETLEHWR